MTAENHVFLSYRTKEETFALQLWASLRDAGLNIWMDRFSIQVGDDWMMSIQTALDTCEAMVAVISPLYIQSDYCMTELHRLTTRPKAGRIYPLLLHKVEPEQRPLEIQRLQHIDFTKDHDPTSQGYQRHVNDLIEALRKQHPAHFGPIPDVLERYVNHLIADLETFQGVLEYVDLSAQTTTLDESPSAEVRPEVYRPDPRQQRLAPGLALIKQALQNDGATLQTEALSSWQAALQQMPRFVLLGEPGAGKSTILRRMAVDAGHAYLSDTTQPLPFFVRLSEWSRDTNAPDFIRMQWHEQQLPHSVDPIEFLRQGKAILYLDGLDEMGRAGRVKAHLLREWLHSPAAPRYAIITARREEYTAVLSLELPTVLLEPMNTQQVKQFVGNYLQDRAPDFLQRLGTSAGDDRIARKNLTKLAQNPYLLSALIIAYRAAPAGEALPTNPGKLTSVLLKALWEREESKNAAGWVHYVDMEAAFSRLAFAIIDGEKPNDVSRTFAIDQVGSYGLIQAGHSANILAIDGDNIRFYHELMQDYFAAMRLKEVGFKDRLAMPTFTATHRIPDKWDQALLALAGIVKKPDAVVQDLAVIDPYLAQACITNDLRISEETIALVVQRLAGIFDLDVNWRNYAQDLMEYQKTAGAKQQAAFQCLVALGDTALPALIPLLNNSTVNALVKWSVVQVLATIDNAESNYALMQVVTQPDAEQAAIQMAHQKARSLETMNQAVQIAGKVGKMVMGRQRTIGEQTQREQLSYSLADRDLRYRIIALHALIQRPSSDLRPFIEKVAANDPDPMLRQMAADGLK